MKRFTIIVIEDGSDHSVELMEVDTNPDELVKGLRAKKRKLGKRRVSHYSSVWVRDNGEQ
jgi:hypothetical protein